MKVAATYSLMKPIFPPSLLGANKGIFGFNLGTLSGKESYFKEAVRDLLKLYDADSLKPFIGKSSRLIKSLKHIVCCRLDNRSGKSSLLLESNILRRSFLATTRVLQMLSSCET